MVLPDVSPALQERLGREGTLGLLSLFEAARHEWSAEVIHQTLERFERRLTEDTNGLKATISLIEGSVRLEIKQEASQLRSELKQGLSDLRVELKGDISRLDAGVKEVLLDQTRWMFGMWVGQVAATAAIVAGMFRVFAR